MTSKIQTKIYDTIEKLESLKSIHRHFQETEKNLNEYERRLEKMNKQLEKELQDIENLEGVSIKGLFHKVLGSKEEQVEKERQEYLDLSLQHQEFVKEIELLEYELEILNKKISDVSPLEKRLTLLKEEREKEILTSSEPIRNRLIKIHKQLDKLKSHAAEVTEAYRAGEHARQSLSMVINYLKEASKWGNWDRMSKGGYYYDRKKYDSIDRAVNEAYRSRQLLTLFARELKDVGIELGRINLEIGEIGGFMDRLFDNLITDWVVQNKINHAYNNVQSTFNKVNRLVLSLKNEINDLNKKRRELEVQKDRILIE